MTMKLFAFALVPIVTLGGTMPVSAAASQLMIGGPSVELRPDTNQKSRTLSPTLLPLHQSFTNGSRAYANGLVAPRPYQVHDDHLPQSKSSLPAQTLKGGSDKAPVLDQLQQRLAARDKELATLREKTTAANELLHAEKQRIGGLETQLSHKEQEVKTVRDRGELQGQTPQESSSSKIDLEQAKQKIETLERELAISNFENAKRRIGELDRQLEAKDKEIAALRSPSDESFKLKGDLVLQTEDLNKAKHRVAELEQQLAGKEQELAQVKDSLNQATLRLSDLDPQLKATARNAELIQAKQLLVELERNSSKPSEPAPSQEQNPAERVPSGPAPSDGGEASVSGLAKINESLTGVLRDELKNGTVSLRKRGDTMILALASGELFAPGEATMTPGGTSLIERIGTTLHQFRYQGIEVAGHTDNKPVRNDPRRTFHDNVQLSQARAEHASQALINSGLDANRVKAVGYAATKPIASNDSEKGRSKNRRVEIIVTPESGAVGLSGAKDKEGRRKSPVASHQKKRVMEKVLNR